MPPLHPVTITITQDGAPLADAAIMLYPKNSAMAHWGAGGMTDAKGTVTLHTLGRYPGLPLGVYKVTVSKTELEPSSFVGEPTEERMDEFEKAEAKRKSFSLVEQTYGDAEKTSLEIEVVDGKNQKSFDVGKAVRNLIAN